MKVYPVFLIGLSDKRCVVIGGGSAAESKVEGLLECDAAVTVIHPELTDRLQAWVRAGKVSWIRREYESGDLGGAFLVISAREDPQINERIWREAESEGALINVVDDAPYCNFIAGAVVRQGSLVIAISTSGCSPALAVRLKQGLSRELGEEYVAFLEWMASLREPVAARYPNVQQRRDLWYALVDSDIIDHLRAGQPELAHRRAAEILGDELLATATVRKSGH